MNPLPFDADRVLQQTFVAQVEHHATIASTNDRAIQYATGLRATSQRSAGQCGELPLLIVADCQTAGRGRGRHRWWTGRGSLAMSLLLDAGQPWATDLSSPPMVALAVGVALVETLAPKIPSHTVGIHWPNDIMAADRKLAGILVEVLPDRRHVVGIGINTNNFLHDAPTELRDTATTLRELTGEQHDHTRLLIELLGQIEHAFSQLASAPQQIAARANGRCLQRGRMLTLQSGNRSVRGRCGGIAPDGALILDTPRGRQSYYSGVLLP